VAEIITGSSDELLVELITEKAKLAIPPKTPVEAAEKAIIKAHAKAKELTQLLDQMEKKYGNLTDIHALAAALATGAAKQGAIELPVTQPLDTHANHEKNHLEGQRSFWAGLANLLQLMSETQSGEDSLLDHTIVMAGSEFSRTPALNTAKGKDHNPFTNSVLLAGGPIRGGETVGKSRVIPLSKSKTGMAEHYAAPFNYKEGKLAESPEGASFFYPENLIRTLMKAYGDPANFTAIDYRTPMIPGLLKSI
jgi:uncharacterized protein (DUF1501 family)